MGPIILWPVVNRFYTSMLHHHLLHQLETILKIVTNKKKSVNILRTWKILNFQPSHNLHNRCRTLNHHHTYLTNSKQLSHLCSPLSFSHIQSFFFIYIINENLIEMRRNSGTRVYKRISYRITI